MATPIVKGYILHQHDHGEVGVQREHDTAFGGGRPGRDTAYVVPDRQRIANLAQIRDDEVGDVVEVTPCVLLSLAQYDALIAQATAGLLP